MKNLYLSSLFVMLATLAVGCGSNGNTPVTAATQDSGRSWSVELSMSGGIVGLQRQLTVESTGEWRAIDRKQGHKNGRITTEQLAQLNQTLSALEDAPDVKTMRSFPSRCADCVESRINAVISGKHYNTMIYSGVKVTQPYQDLFSQLSPLMQAAFSK